MNEKISPGTQIGRYQVASELGHGGMGTVFLAEDPMIGRRVAIKVIRMDDSGSAEQQRMIAQSFLKETRLAGVLHHPGVVGVFDAGRQDNLAYIVMEYIDGPTLSALLLETPRPDLRKLLDICRQTAAVLDYAHAHGVIHRDIKPTNMLVQHDGAIKICDFGIAKVAQSTEFTVTQAGMALGTPEFMSPEQVLGQPLDGRADQWSLAVVAYEVLTGTRPFHAESYTQVMAQIMTLDPDPVCSRNAALPKAVDTVFSKALAKKPADRFSNCSDFMEALERAFAPRSSAAETLATVAAPPPAVTALPPPTPTPIRTQAPAPSPTTAPTMIPAPPAVGETLAEPVRKSGPGKMIAVAAVAILLVGGAIAWRVLRPAAPAPVETVPAPVSPAKPTPAPTSRRVSGHAAPALASAPPPAPGKASAAVRSVKLVTLPEGVDLTVDGKTDPVCHTPCAVELADGRHTVLARQEGYYPLVKDFTVEEDQPEIKFTLSQITGSLMIATDPAGAAISVNGTPRTETTNTSLNLPMGKYKVRLTKEGFEPLEHEVTISGEGIFRLTVSLAKTSH